jgi:hypothetical protein
VSRQWSSSGIDRYAGFSRASFSAASQLLILAIWLVVTGKRSVVKLLIWFTAGLGIVLTNSKGPVAAWLIVSLFFSTGKIMRYGRIWRRLWVSILYFTLICVIVLPLSTLVYRYESQLNSYTDLSLFASFVDRLYSMWPSSLGLLGGGLDWVTGRGLGGIGSAQMFFERDKYLPGDNVFVYLAVTIGVPAACLSLMILAKRVSSFLRHSENGVLVFAIFLFTVIYGLVVNVIEDPLLAFFLGVVVAASIRSELGRA